LRPPGHEAVTIRAHRSGRPEQDQLPLLRAGQVETEPGMVSGWHHWTAHRESNPTREPSLAVIARVGGGIPRVNVDGPAKR
jgi:hypothetical protein